MKEFTSSYRAREVDTGLRDLEFTLDGAQYTLRAPKDSQLAFLAASSASSRRDEDRVAAILDFIESILEPPGAEIIRLRLLNPNDNLELDDLIGIMNWALEEWSGRPPTSAAVSSQRRSRNGRPSKAIASDATSNRSR